MLRNSSEAIELTDHYSDDEDETISLPPVPRMDERTLEEDEEGDITIEIEEEDDDPIWVDQCISDLMEPTPNEIIEAQKEELPPVLPRGMYLRDGRYIYMNGIWVPPSLRSRLLEAIHLLPPLWHPSAKKMLMVLKRLYN